MQYWLEQSNKNKCNIKNYIDILFWFDLILICFFMISSQVKFKKCDIVSAVSKDLAHWRQFYSIAYLKAAVLFGPVMLRVGIEEIF